VRVKKIYSSQVPPTETGWAVESCRQSGEGPAPAFGDLRLFDIGVKGE